MSTAERRNHYRVLHVQPEAPDAVIQSSYRALMTKLRIHPDLGGDTERAALLNAAYAVLSDPQRRREYDLSLQRPARRHAAAPTFDPATWLASSCCPFCRFAFAGPPAPGRRCAACDSPLAPAPSPQQSPGEIVGRRRGQRYARGIEARLRLPGENVDRRVQMRDLSLTGLSLVSSTRIDVGTPLRVVGDTFETVALTVGCRAATLVWTVHARLLTLQMLRSERGVWVNARA